MKKFTKNKLSRVLKDVNYKNIILRYSVLFITLFVSACTFNLLQVKLNLVTGGTTGIAIILNHLLELDPYRVVFIISAALLILSIFVLGIEKTISSLIITFVYPIFISMTANIGDIIFVNTKDVVIIAIFIGLIGGVTSGIIYKMNFSNGGLSIISDILYKYFKISVAKTNLVINGIIVFVGGLYFGWTMVMYAAISVYISSIVVDKVVLGISNNKSLYILTTKEKEIEKYIIEVLGHGVTEFNVKGGFELNKKHALMTVVPNSDYFKLKEGVGEIDKDAFLIVTDSYQLYGGE